MVGHEEMVLNVFNARFLTRFSFDGEVARVCAWFNGKVSRDWLGEKIIHGDCFSLLSIECGKAEEAERLIAFAILNPPKNSENMQIHIAVSGSFANDLQKIILP